MGLIKALTRTDGVRAALCRLLACYIRLVHASGRWRVIGGEIPARYWQSGQPFILAFWHGRIMMMPYCWRRDQPIHMLISQHRDGQIIARTVSHFGIETVSGSSSKGGTAALRAMLRALKTGRSVGITPDGPRGPRMRAADGVVQVARLAGVPVIPCGFSAQRRRLLASWDRFAVAMPFSRGLFIWGEPITIAGDADQSAIEAARVAIEARLNWVTQEADRQMGHAPVEPGP